MNKLKVYKRDSMKHVDETSLVQLSRDLLLALVESTDALSVKKMNEQNMREMKLVLNYLNAANSQIKTRMQFFRMTGLKDKINRVKEKSRVISE